MVVSSPQAEPSAPRPHEKLAPTEADGALAIQDGRVLYFPPKGAGAYPVVEPGELVRVYCNDRLITGPTVVMPGDRLRLEVADEPPTLRLEVRLREDELMATLVILRRAGTHYRIADTEPRRVLKPHAVPAASIDPPAVSLAEAQAALERAGVRYGVDLSALQRAVEEANRSASPEPRSFVVAVGDPPRLPRDSEIQLANGLRSGDLVEAGQVLASKSPAVPGRPGRTVRGREIPVPEPRDVPIRAAAGVAVSEDGRVATATHGGRLVVRGFALTVRRIHQVAGDLTAADSPLRFPGDVYIAGQAAPGSSVIAGGKVEIGGPVDSATIQAAEGIRSGGGVFRSTLQAGLPAGEADPTLLAMLQLIAQELLRMERLTRAVVRETGRPEGEVARAVLERRGVHLRAALRKLQEHPGREHLPDRLADVLAARLSGRALASLERAEDLRALAERVEAALEQLKAESPGEASIHVPYAHNSVIKASGTIYLVGQGSYQSQLHAGTGVEAPVGSLMGGEIVTARGDVICQTLGGGSAVTRVSVGKGFRVQAKAVLPDVVLQIGGYRTTITRPERFVTFLVEDDRIVARAWR